RGLDVRAGRRGPPAAAAGAHVCALRVVRWIARPVRHPLAWLFVWFLALPLLMTAANSTVSLGTEIVVFTLLAIAYNLLMGYTGLVSFGHSAFFGLGGYAAGLTQIHVAQGMVVPLLAGVAAAALAGAAIGFLL